MWLRDALPKHLPQLRVWIYGYDSNLQDSESIGDVYEYAESFRRDLRILRGKTKVGHSKFSMCVSGSRWQFDAADKPSHMQR